MGKLREVEQVGTLPCVVALCREACMCINEARSLDTEGIVLRRLGRWVVGFSSPKVYNLSYSKVHVLCLCSSLLS